ncbi:MAG: methyltransferase domain-containing protein, partial [Actinomycetota bacterium]|nr:methyltransferase domain-containing protein [Actinomycetota bacterium]
MSGADPLERWLGASGDGDFKACCAQLYETEAARLLLGDDLHPGGAALTLRLAALAGVGPGQRVLDVASGRGTTARLLGEQLGAEVVGVELGEAAVLAARREADRAGLSERVDFLTGDAESLPLPEQSFDHVFCECSLCTFPDKSRALAEMARVLRPGGTVAIADVTADRTALPDELGGAMARVACVADALSEDEYGSLLREAGFAVLEVERHADALAAMTERVSARLRVARMLALSGPDGDAARAAVRLAGLAR